MTTLFEQLIQNETVASVRARIVAHAQAAELAITNWIVGSVGEQLLATMTSATHLASLTYAKAIRGFASLDTSTDPGDEDPYEPGNANLEPAAGFLSVLGENTFRTIRGEATFATGFVSFTNAGPAIRTFSPGALTITWTDDPPDPPPTYRNAPDDSLYTNPDGTITVGVGVTVDLPIVAEEAGTRSNAGPETLTLTTTLNGCSITNASPIVGTDRESAPDYRARCKQAPNRVSLSGPGGAYGYLARTNLDDTPLLNASGAAVNISRVQVSEESATGIVDVCFASPSGAAIAEDVTAANANIESESFAVPDAITYTGAAATEVEINVSGTAKLKNAPGASTDDAEAAITAALTAAFAAFEIGGVDQVDGAGVIYTTDLRAIAACAYPGLYDVALVSPVGASTALAKGEVAVFATSGWEITLV